MDIHEIKRQKRELEDKLQAELDFFERIAGVKVSELRLKRHVWAYEAEEEADSEYIIECRLEL